MAVKTYQAYTMSEALDAAKRDLGAEATILETRSFKRGGILGFGKKTIFELTATEADRVQLSRANKIVNKNRLASNAAQKAYSKIATPSKANEQQSSITVIDADDQIRTRRLAQALAEAHDRRQKTTTEVDQTTAAASISTNRMADQTSAFSNYNTQISAISQGPPLSKVISKAPPPVVIPVREKPDPPQPQIEYVGGSQKVAKRFLLTSTDKNEPNRLVVRPKSL